MRSPYPRKTIHFNRDFINGKSGLFEWLNQVTARTGNISKFMYDALAIARLFDGSISQAQDAFECHKACQSIFGPNWRQVLASLEFNEADAIIRARKTEIEAGEELER